MGLALRAEPRAPRDVDREDRELVTMASRQAAGYLSEQRAAHALAEAREFEKVNPSYALVTHDIKNLVSQPSFRVRQYEKHGESSDLPRDTPAKVQTTGASRQTTGKG